MVLVYEVIDSIASIKMSEINAIPRKSHPNATK
jgi:hypothetical protein